MISRYSATNCAAAALAAQVRACVIAPTTRLGLGNKGKLLGKLTHLDGGQWIMFDPTGRAPVKLVGGVRVPL